MHEKMATQPYDYVVIIAQIWIIFQLPLQGAGQCNQEKTYKIGSAVSPKYKLAFLILELVKGNKPVTDHEENTADKQQHTPGIMQLEQCGNA